MEVIVQSNAREACLLAAKFVASEIRANPRTVLGLATGETLKPFYADLVRLHKEGLDLSKVHCFNLDEFVGLAQKHPNSYASYMQKHFFAHVNIPAERIYFPDGCARDIPLACAEYEEKIAEVGGLDVQILGIGVEGHIGFNEPTSSLASRTRIKTLTQHTISLVSRYFENEKEVPRQVLTMGVGTIMSARRIALVATGKDKADIIRKTIEGPITGLVPASALQMHQTAKIFLDEEAAAGLMLKPYYRWAFENKPEWQKFD